jgi:imidazolonepropionase-like amidohydrolase
MLKTVLKKLAKFVAALMLIAVTVLAASIPTARMEWPSDLQPVNNEQPLAIDNVNLVTMVDEQVLADRQLLIRNGIIERIEPAGVAVGDEYRHVDAEGAYLMPGLFDMHVHAMDRKNLVLSLAYGVTSVRNMGGYPMHLRWRQELAEGQWLGSNLFSATPTMNGRKNANPLGQKIVTEPDKARELVRRYHSQGWDFVKAYARLDVPVYEAIIDEAGRLEFPVAGHVPYSVVEADYGLAKPMATLEHTEDIFQGPLEYQYDDDAVKAIARQLKDMNATVTPTLMIFDHLTRLARDKQAFLDELPLEYLNPMMKRFVDATAGERWLGAGEKLQASLEKRNSYFQYITLVLHETGVNLVLGTDWGAIYAIPGSSTHDEIALLQEAGLPAEAVLKMATINAARVLRVEDRLGSIVEGKTADLILVAYNPMTDPKYLRQPLAVVKNGQWLDKNDLDRLKETASNPSSTYITMGRVLEFLID